MTNNLMRAMTALDSANRKIMDTAFATAFDMIQSNDSPPRTLREALVPIFDIIADDAGDDPASHDLTPSEYEDLARLAHRIAERLDREDLARRPISFP